MTDLGLLMVGIEPLGGLMGMVVSVLLARSLFGLSLLKGATIGLVSLLTYLAIYTAGTRFLIASDLTNYTALTLMVALLPVYGAVIAVLMAGLFGRFAFQVALMQGLVLSIASIGAYFIVRQLIVAIAISTVGGPPTEMRPRAGVHYGEPEPRVEENCINPPCSRTEANSGYVGPGYVGPGYVGRE